MQQALAHLFGVAGQQPLRLAFGLQREQGKGHIGILVVHDGADDARGQIGRFIAQLLARLIELFLDLGGRRAVEQGHCGKGQARTGIGLRAVVPAQFLHALFQTFRHLVLHFLRGGARPGRDDGHGLDREGGILRPAKLEEGDDASHRYQDDQEQRDGPLPDGERGKVEATHCCTPRPGSRAATVSLAATRTCSPSRKRWAPSATMRSPILRSPATLAASSPRPRTFTGRQLTRLSFGSSTHTPGPLPASCSARSAPADRMARGGIAFREPDGHGRAERGFGQRAFEHIPRFIRPGLSVRRIRELPELRWHGHAVLAIERGLADGTDGRTQGFRQLDDGLAATGMCDAHHDLAGVDHLASVSKRFDDHAIGIGYQYCIAHRVPCHVGLGLRRIELRPGRVRRGFDLVIGRGRYAPDPTRSR